MRAWELRHAASAISRMEDDRKQVQEANDNNYISAFSTQF